MIKKGRPKKKKIIQHTPAIDHFTPEGTAGARDISSITMEEYESIRLQDYLGMPQKKAAGLMHISQQSFSILVRKARKKISDAIVNAKIIRIEGGDFLSRRSLELTNKLKRKKLELLDKEI